MLTKSFYYNLPRNLIAQKPSSPRDFSKLLVLDKKSGEIKHEIFKNLPELLKPGDVVVFNDSKVFKARLFGKKETGGAVETFLLNMPKSGICEVLIGGHEAKEGVTIEFKKNLKGVIIKNLGKTKLMKFNKCGKTLDDIIDKIGSAPTPPYIKEKTPLKNYQTVYAKNTGSVAAPTAGLHFTKRLIKRLKLKGVILENITLHVGLGTFEPIKSETIENHKIHKEYATISKKTAQEINKAKKEKRSVIAVGTTSVRAIEAFSDKKGLIKSGTKNIGIYIYPGYKFKLVDVMVTNFHLPCSSLIVLVSAFAGKEKILKAYKKAINKKYRFYSLGDAMFIK